MRRPTARGILLRYAAAWSYLIGVTVAEIVYALLPSGDQATLLQWASTNVYNLRHDPAGCLVVSAFFPSGSATSWPFLIALALFGANHVLGNRRTIVVCVAGHVVGTLVSEGIVYYRVTSGVLPPSARHILDVGPSYVVVAAIATAILWGPWAARAAAVADLALLTFIGGIFSGLTTLDVAAVGHVTAITTGAVASSLAVWQLRRRRQAASAAAAALPPGRPPDLPPEREASAAQPRPPA
jgi:hypothetical protein